MHNIIVVLVLHVCQMSSMRALMLDYECSLRWRLQLLYWVDNISFYIQSENVVWRDLWVFMGK